MAAKSKSGNGRETRLTEHRIHTAALALVDADGIEALSMRKLAGALRVNPMSLYHHVANKAALLDGMVRLVATELTLPTGGPWQHRLRELAYAFRTLTQAHPALVRYTFTSGFIQREGALWRALRDVLRDAGVPDDDLDSVGGVLTGLVGGLLLTEAGAMLADLGAAPQRGDPFDIAVDMLVAGLAARVGHPPAQRPGAVGPGAVADAS